MRADGADVIHLPRPGLVAVGAAGERTHGANIDAGAAFIAFEVIAVVGNNLGNRAAIGDSQRAHAHPLIAGAHTTVAENAAGTIEVHHRRPLLLVGVQLAFDEAALAGAVAEHHVLQLAFAA